MTEESQQGVVVSHREGVARPGHSTTARASGPIPRDLRHLSAVTAGELS